MNKLTISLLLVLFSFPMTARAAAVNAALPPFQETPAFKQFQQRPKNELSKIIYLMDRFKAAPLTVIYDRVEYDSNKALKYAKSYVAKHYKREEAEAWIKEHAYRSLNGSVIYVKYPDGQKLPLRDLLIQELQLISA
jgi:hypothetical protein